MRILYTCLLYCATPFIMLRLLWRSRRAIGYRQRWHERFAIKLPPTSTAKPYIWLHAVSLGETLAALPLVKALLKHQPNYQLIITATTPTGSAQITKHFANTITVTHVYTPYDLPVIIKRFLKHFNPRLLVIMETELWPNLIHYTHQHRIPILLANARLSQRSCRGYQRIKSLTHPMMQSLSAIAAQTGADGKRFRQLGLTDDQLHIVGNIKFDLQLPTDLLEHGSKLRHHWTNRPTLIAASTHDGEESYILKVFSIILQKYSHALLIIVPRHPERFNKVAELCRRQGHRIAQRSLEQIPDASTTVYLGDTMGELLKLYAASDVAFVGGSIANVGGHNLIEPAALKLPIICGPNLQNFLAIRDLMLEANALYIEDKIERFAATVIKLFADQNLRSAQGRRAYQVSEQNKGAVKSHIKLIDSLITT